MPEQTNNRCHQVTTDNLCILQLNLNKSKKAHLELMNNRLSTKYEIILIQEPHVNIFNNIRTPNNFRPVFPVNRLQNQDTIRSVIWVNKNIDTSNWIALDIPDTNDITAIQIKNTTGIISIFNIYNDCNHSQNEQHLHRYIANNRQKILANPTYQMIWASNFNRHHPLWDDNNDIHLFTQQAIARAGSIIKLLANYTLDMALPKGIPTLQHMVTKRSSRPDNVFITSGLSELITSCEVDPTSKPPYTDHFPIITKLQIPQKSANTQISYNFKTTDWTAFKQNL